MMPDIYSCPKVQELMGKYLNAPKYNKARRHDELKQHIQGCATCQAAMIAMKNYNDKAVMPDLTEQEMERV